MMKIKTFEIDGGLVLQVEGRLAGAFVPELEGSWKAVRTSHPEWKISVDLKNVTCVDRTGRLLLKVLHVNGVGFLRAELAIQDILEEVTENDSLSEPSKPQSIGRS
jgi:hypothetical protein